MDAFHKYQDQVGVVVMSWSPDGLPLDWELLQAMRAAHTTVDFVVIGEPHGATGSTEFWTMPNSLKMRILGLSTIILLRLIWFKTMFTWSNSFGHHKKNGPSAVNSLKDHFHLSV